MWSAQVGNSWRAGIDVFSVWDAQEAKRLKLPNFLQSIATAIESVENYADHAGPGQYQSCQCTFVHLSVCLVGLHSTS